MTDILATIFLSVSVHKIMTISLTVYNLFTNIMSKIHIYKAQNTGKLDCLIFEVYAIFLHSSVYGVETLTGMKLITWTWAIFIKKSRNRSIFVFPCPHFGVYGFCIYPPVTAQPPLTFFFKYKGIPSDTSFESPLRKKYNALFVF
jgi:hypothetical protein